MNIGNRSISCELITEKVYNYIMDDVVEGYYKPGEKLIVRKLCERYNISDTPVKQALNRLISEGIVINIPHKGIWVKKFDRKEVTDILKARLMIEDYCIVSYCKNAADNPALGENLTDIIEEHRKLMCSAGSGHTSAEYLQHQKLDYAFHRTIVETAGNPCILRLYTYVRPHIYMYQIYGMRGADEMKNTFSEHEKIYECLMSCDEAGARRMLAYHFDSFFRDIPKLYPENIDKR